MIPRLLLLALLLFFVPMPLAPAQAPAPLEFAWQVPGSVDVQEVVTREGKTWRLSYRVKLKRGEARPLGDDLAPGILLRFTRVSVYELNGQKLGELPEATRRAMQVMSRNLPDIWVSADGRRAEIADIDAAVSSTLTALRATGAIDEAGLALTEEDLRSELGMARLIDEGTQFWPAWVGTWASQQPSEAKSQSTFERKEVRGAKLPFAVELRQLPPDLKHPGYLRFERKAKSSGKKATAAWSKMMLAKLPPDTPASDRPKLSHFRLEDTAEVTTSAPGLRPIRAMTERRLELGLNGAEPKTELERHEYRFTWVK